VPCAADHAPGSQQSSSQLRPPPSPDALSLTLPDASVMPEYCPHLLSTFALGPGSIHRVGDHGIQTAGLPPSIMYGGAACPNDHPNLRASRRWTRPEHGGHYRALIHLPEPPAPAVCAWRASIWPAPPPPFPLLATVAAKCTARLPLLGGSTHVALAGGTPARQD